jgi:DNA-binding LacI/PurR family transcriptional regulator
MEPSTGLFVVSIDNQYGGTVATEHLIEQGYRNICHISGPLDWWEARKRKQGWLDALQAHKMPISVLQSVEGTWSSSSGEKAMRKLLKQYPEMDAVFVANDQMALGALQVCCRFGLAVPDRLGVVGFDDISEAGFFFPSLTTVSQDHAGMGAQAVQELVNAIEKGFQKQEMEETQSIVIKPQLVVRDSSMRSQKFLT